MSKWGKETALLTCIRILISKCRMNSNKTENQYEATITKTVGEKIHPRLQNINA